MGTPTPSTQAQGQGSVGADAFNANTQSVQTAAQLRTFIGVSGVNVSLAGIAAPGDGLGGLFYWNATGTAPDDNLNIIRPPTAVQGEWLRVGQPGGATGQVLVSTVTIGPSALNTLFSAPVTLVPAPPAGYWIFPISFAFDYNFVSVSPTYTGSTVPYWGPPSNNQYVLYYGTFITPWSIDSGSWVWTWPGVSPNGSVPYALASESSLNGAALTFGDANADSTSTSDSSLRVTTVYTIVPIQVA